MVYKGRNPKETKVTNKGKEPKIEHFHTPGSLENILSWGDQPISEPADEFVDLESITYDQHPRAIMKRT